MGQFEEPGPVNFVGRPMQATESSVTGERRRIVAKPEQEFPGARTRSQAPNPPSTRPPAVRENPVGPPAAAARPMIDRPMGPPSPESLLPERGRTHGSIDHGPR